MGPESGTPCSNASNYEEDDKNWGRKGVRKVLGLKKELAIDSDSQLRMV